MPKYKFNIRQRLINKKIRDKFTLEKDDDTIIIKNLENKETKTIQLNENLEISITGKPDIFNIENSIKIEF